jgi:hypothetical protein
MLVAASCSREDDAARSTRSSDPPYTLADTFHYLRACREDRAYIELKEYVAPESGESTVALLQAMDGLMAANQGALRAMRSSCPTIDTRPYDLSLLADLLDLFSRDVELVSTEQEGDQGQVTFEIGEQVAPEPAVFRRERGHWVYVPGEQDAAMTAHLREAADALTRLARRWEKAPVSEREIHNTYQTRILPELRQAASTIAENEAQAPATRDSGDAVN